MSLVIAIAILLLSLVILIFAGDKFVGSSVSIARKMKIPQAVIGATLVSLGTTLPEMLVTIFSIKEQSGGIAIGNGLGSIIFNTALIGGLLLIFSKGIKKQKSILPIILICSILLLLVMSLNGIISVWESIVLLIVFTVFIILNYFEIKKNTERSNEQNGEADVNLKKEILFFVLSAIAIGISAYYMVEEAKIIGAILNISDTIIGLIVVAIGTSLPELVTTISAIRKKQLGLSIGNIIGSNIINGTLLIGLTGIFSSSLSIGKETLLITIPLALFCSIILLFGLNVKEKKLVGTTLLFIYIMYYIFLILRAFNIVII